MIPNTIDVTASPDTIGDGDDPGPNPTSQVCAFVRDAENFPVSGITVNFRDIGPGSIIGDPAPETADDGVACTTYGTDATSANAGDITVSVVASVSNLSATVTITITDDDIP